MQYCEDMNTKYIYPNDQFYYFNYYDANNKATRFEYSTYKQIKLEGIPLNQLCVK